MQLVGGFITAGSPAAKCARC